MESDLDRRFQEAVQYFWAGRDLAQQRQIESGKVDAGSRGAVTSGRHMAGIEKLIVELLLEAGLNRTDVKIKMRESFPSPRLELPGFYRPEKQWDLIVIIDGQLLAAIEFKSQVGSYGNNFNNRVEEAIGNATDFWTAFREGRLGKIRPFLGYFFLLNDEPKVHVPVRMKQPYFGADPEFGQASYAQRYQVLCNRLVSERLYDAACFALATRSVPSDVSFPSESLSFANFSAQLQGFANGIARMATS
jgi:hypothetical protein